jgi:uncharacterized membrane protein
MLEFLYQTLTKIGYTHPIHPPVTHLTVGMVIGAFYSVLLPGNCATTVWPKRLTTALF